jgi:hypothetical protein
MTNLIRIAALLGVVLSASTAQAKISTLAECYAVVTAYCNTKARPEVCLNHALDECDEEFKKFEIPTTRRTPGFKAN